MSRSQGFFRPKHTGSICRKANEACSPLGKPPLVNHPSHIGYLTSSSPQIMAVVVPIAPSLLQDHETSSTKFDGLLGKSKTMAASRSPSTSPSRPVLGGNRSNIASSPVRPKNGDIARIDNLPGQTSPFTKEYSFSSGTIAARRQSKGSETSSFPALQLAKSLTSKSNDSVPSIVTIPDTPPHSADKFTAAAPPIRPATVIEDYSHRPLAAKSLATHRRIRSDGPPTSKLSQSMAPPLTPLEEARTPIGSRNPSGTNNGGGFFSSVFSVAQNAANTLTNTLQTNTRPKTSALNRTSVENSDLLDQQETAEVNLQEPIRPLAIETLGSGDLSLDHLGITLDPPAGESSPTPSIHHTNGDIGRSRSNTVIHNEQASAKAEGESAARAVSAAYSIVRNGEPGVTPMAKDVTTPKPRPASTIDVVPQEERTPLTGSIFEDTTTVTRSGSIRSKLDRTRKSHRNSSGTTLGGPIASYYGALAGNTASRFAGFNKANTKRNKDFHNFFRSVPDDDDLIEDYSCALQRDIILAGRIYISEGHVCFSSNILGWVTNLVISFDEIVSVEKESTAMLFANAIAIQTLHARHTFRSLLSRDATYDLIVSIWRLNHPGLESSPVKTHRVLNGDDHGSEGSVNSHGPDEETDSNDSRSFMDSVEASVNGEESMPRKATALVSNSIAQSASPIFNGGNASEKLASSVGSLVDYPGPATHVPTECNDATAHLEKLLKDDIIPAPLGKVYSLVFGSASTTFMSRWLQDEMKVTELQVDDNKALLEAKQIRTITYVKPLSNPIGPRSTKCIITEHMDLLDLEKAVIVSITTQTPDVPSGSLFSTKTKYCLMWGPNNSTRIIMTYTIEWTSKSWLKGNICFPHTTLQG